MTSSRELNQRPRGTSGSGAFVPTYHREMLMDRRRVRAFQRTIARHGAPHRTFMEFGAGTGIMSAYAAHHFGRVIAVERDPEMFEVCVDNLGASGLLDKNVTVLRADALEAELPRADVIMAEMLSTLMIHEPQVPAMNRARSLLEPGGTLIPARVINLVTLGWSKFATQGIEFRSPYTVFTGVQPPEALSESRVFFVADFARGEVERDVDARVEVECLFDGEINCLILSSLLDLAPGLTFGSSDSLDPPMVAPVEPLSGVAGQRLQVRIAYRHFADWSSFRGVVEPS